MSDRHPCSATIWGPRVQSWGCQNTASVERKGKWYCKIHDPERVKEKREAKEAQRIAANEADRKIALEADSIVKALGAGSPDWNYRAGGHIRRVVLTFDEARSLIARLK